MVGITHLEVFSSKELDAHDGEDEPEDETDKEHIEDTRDGLDESIYYNLKYSTSNSIFSV